MSRPQKSAPEGAPLTEKGKRKKFPSTEKKKLRPTIPPHPGNILRDLIGEKNISQKNLETVARTLATSRIELTKLIDGEISLSAGMALRLSRVFEGRSAHQWMKLQIDRDFYFSEIFLKQLTEGRYINFNYLLPRDSRKENGEPKTDKKYRAAMTTFMCKQIVENANKSRKEAGQKRLTAKDFEIAFNLGTGARGDEHSGRQWRRMINSGQGVVDEKFHQIKNKAIEMGWLEQTRFPITESIQNDFLDEADGLYLKDLLIKSAIHLGEVHKITKGSQKLRINLEFSLNDDARNFILEILKENIETLSELLPTTGVEILDALPNMWRRI
ncbi:transcriptional regulator [Paraburkholderia sp. B3]|uniref:helix-turn-helix transcriptional regulator n=1 Tax=Paraburkholderia sp. B3 TaxID=3134791 RepID=UPI003981A4DC